MAAFDLDALALQQGTKVTFHLADPGVMDDDRINHAVSVTPAGLLACTGDRGFGSSDKRPECDLCVSVDEQRDDVGCRPDVPD